MGSGTNKISSRSLSGLRLGTILNIIVHEANNFAQEDTIIEIEAVDVSTTKNMKFVSNQKSHEHRSPLCWFHCVGCEKSVTLFHKGDRIIDIEAVKVSATESTPYVPDPKRHLGYMYNALRNMSKLATEPGRKYVISN